MREIKFRIWNKRTKKWNEDWLLASIIIDKNGKLVANCPDMINDNIVFVQYTGLHDKNGKNIWEGDIVRIAGYGNYIVEWPFIQLFQSSFENDVEYILGNIYENPELLEEA